MLAQQRARAMEALNGCGLAEGGATPLARHGADADVETVSDTRSAVTSFASPPAYPREQCGEHGLFPHRPGDTAPTMMEPATPGYTPVDLPAPLRWQTLGPPVADAWREIRWRAPAASHQGMPQTLLACRGQACCPSNCRRGGKAPNWRLATGLRPSPCPSSKKVMRRNVAVMARGVELEFENEPKWPNGANASAGTDMPSRTDQASCRRSPAPRSQIKRRPCNVLSYSSTDQLTRQQTSKARQASRSCAMSIQSA